MSYFFDNYESYEYALATAQLAFAMLGMGLLLTPADFALVFRRPRELSVGLVLQFIAAPLLAFLIGRVLPVEPGVAAGLALIAAVPGGTLSNIMTLFARGNIALSIALTSVATIASLATTPFILRLVGGDSFPPGFVMPVGRIAFEIGVVLLAPLFAGMLLGSKIGSRREGLSKACIRISLALIAAIVIGSMGAGRLEPERFSVWAPVSVALLCVGLQLVAYTSATLSGFAPADRAAVSIEVTIRNSNLALMVKASLFPAVAGVIDPIGDAMFFVALLYGAVAMPVSLIQVFLGRRTVS